MPLYQPVLTLERKRPRAKSQKTILAEFYKDLGIKRYTIRENTPKEIRLCDCGRKHYANGLCKKHYNAKWKYKPHVRSKFLSEEQRQKRREYHNQYNKTPKGRIIAANNMSRRRAIAKDSDIDTQFLLELWDKQPNCGICSEPMTVDRHLDHILPLVIGGKHMKDNVRFVHPLCNWRRPKDGSDLPK